MAAPGERWPPTEIKIFKNPWAFYLGWPYTQHFVGIFRGPWPPKLKLMQYFQSLCKYKILLLPYYLPKVIRQTKGTKKKSSSSFYMRLGLIFLVWGQKRSSLFEELIHKIQKIVSSIKRNMLALLSQRVSSPWTLILEPSLVIPYLNI